MPAYHHVIDQISTQTGTVFRPASKADLSALRKLQLPKPIVDFYARHEPSECAEAQVRLWPISDIIQENRELVPGAYIAPLGYVVFATTICGDAYCFDLNVVDAQKVPRIVLVSHEAVDEDITAEEAARLAKPVADNLNDFLNKFAREEVDEDCIY